MDIFCYQLQHWTSATLRLSWKSLWIVQSKSFNIKILNESQKRNPNGRYVQGLSGECSADLVENTDTLVLNVGSTRGYRFTRTQECNNPCCMQWSAWTQAPCRTVWKRHSYYISHILWVIKYHYTKHDSKLIFKPKK